MELDELMKKNEKEIIYWLFEINILPEKRICSKCVQPLKLCLAKRSKDLLAWRCSNSKCLNRNIYISVRKDSFFENTHASLKEYMKAIYFWSKGTISANILKHVKIRRSALLKLTNKLAEYVKKFFEKNIIRLGGPGVVVQIDETMLNHKIKAHRGRAPKKQTWALGIVDCSTNPGRGIFKIIEKKSAEEIMPLIFKHVRSGSVIHTDEAAVYKRLALVNGLTHGFVTHKYCFVDYEKGIHTQNIESLNNKLKSKIKQCMGVLSSKRQDFLNVFMWRDLNAKNCYCETLNLIKF